MPSLGQSQATASRQQAGAPDSIYYQGEMDELSFYHRTLTAGCGVHPGALVRNPEQVVESLFRIRQTSAEPAAPRPENKRVWASLLKGKTAVIEEVAQERQRRDPQGIKTRVAVTDGERALQMVEGTLGVTLILDLLQVRRNSGNPLMCSTPMPRLEDFHDSGKTWR